MQTDAVSMLNVAHGRSRLASLTELLGRFPIAIVQCMFRLAVASVFLKAGLNKIASWELTVQLFADEYKVPVHLTWVSILIFLLTRGAGPWSLDRVVGLEPGDTRRA